MYERTAKTQLLKHIIGNSLLDKNSCGVPIIRFICENVYFACKIKKQGADECISKHLKALETKLYLGYERPIKNVYE